MRHIRLDDIPPEPVSHDPTLKKQVMLGDSILPGMRNFSHIVLPPGQKVQEHSHENGFEVFYCIRGEVRFTVNGTEIVMKGEECLVVEPNEAHELMPIEETEFVYFFVFSSP